MKNSIVYFFMAFLVSAFSWANSDVLAAGNGRSDYSDNNSEELNKYTNSWIIQFSKPDLSGQISAIDYNFSLKKEMSFESQYDISIGYRNFSVDDFGYKWAVGMTKIQFPVERNYLRRVEGNLGYSFGPSVTFLVGFNLSQFSEGELNKRLSGHLGHQAELVFQLNRYLGFNLGYISYSQVMRVDEFFSINLNQKGAYLGVSGAF